MAIPNMWVYTTSWKPIEGISVCMGGSTWKPGVTLSVQKGITNPPIGHEPNPDNWQTVANLSPMAPPTTPGPAVSLAATKPFSTQASWSAGPAVHLLYEVDYQPPLHNRSVFKQSGDATDLQSWGSTLGMIPAQVRVSAAFYNDGGTGPRGPWSPWRTLIP